MAHVIIDEKWFLQRFPNALLNPEPPFSTDLNAYDTEEFGWMFSKQDGHLAFLYFKRIEMTVYVCPCIERGLARLEFLEKAWEAHGLGYNCNYA